MRKHGTLFAIVCVLIGCSSSKDNNAMTGSGAAQAGAGAGGMSATGGAGAGGAGGAPLAGEGGASGGAGAASGGAGGSGGTGGSGGSGGSGGAPDIDAAVSDAAMPGDGCTRELLSALVDQFFTALSANDASTLALSTSVKITENGSESALTEGIWTSAGEVAFKHSALDTETCSTLTEAVIADGSSDIPFGVRLKLEADAISEIEMIAVRDGDYFVGSDTELIIESYNEDWLEHAIVPEADRSTRAELIEIVDIYFERFPAGGCNFADDCVRLENGFSPGACALGLSCAESGSGGMTASRHVIDVEAGIAAGFVMFAGSYTDFHMFKVYAGEVHGVHAILGAADQSGWD